MQWWKCCQFQSRQFLKEWHSIWQEPVFSKLQECFFTNIFCWNLICCYILWRHKRWWYFDQIISQSKGVCHDPNVLVTASIAASERWAFVGWTSGWVVLDFVAAPAMALQDLVIYAFSWAVTINLWTAPGFLLIPMIPPAVLVSRVYCLFYC